MVTTLTANDVFRKVKELSALVMNPRPQIFISNISAELSESRESLLPLLTHLSDIKLIRFNEPSMESVKLTLLGNNVNR